MVIEQGKIEAYLEANARPLEIALYSFHFRSGSPAAVLEALAVYQNDDGGFGQALEPDMRLPLSNAIATWTAFQVMHTVGTSPAHPMLRRVLEYLLASYDKARTGWAVVRPEVDSYPHAPWWGYAAALEHFGWGNPSAELLGFLITYRHIIDVEAIIAPMTAKALTRIHEVESSNFHEVFNFKALYHHAADALKKQLKEPLEQLIKKSVCTNPDLWTSYVAPPLSFVSSPDDPFIHLFDEALVNENLAFLQNRIVGGDHWEPNWDWRGQYPEDWQKAKREWSGVLTVKNLLTLKNFGLIGG